jgi:hypothetical protein
MDPANLFSGDSFQNLIAAIGLCATAASVVSFILSFVPSRRYMHELEIDPRLIGLILTGEHVPFLKRQAREFANYAATNGIDRNVSDELTEMANRCDRLAISTDRRHKERIFSTIRRGGSAPSDGM